MKDPTRLIEEVSSQSSWTIKSLLLVLLAFNAYLCLQFLATIWGWLFANLDVRMAILLSISDLSPPIISLYTYLNSERRMQDLCNGYGRIMRPVASNIFSECVKTLGLKNRPELWVINGDFSCPFAFGRSGSSTVVLTGGLVDRLSDDELTGILSHELTHIKNGDHSIMTWASSLVHVYKFFLPIYLMLSVLTMWYDIAFGIGDPVWVFVNSSIRVVMVFAIPTLLVNSLSRTREYMADFVARSITRTYPLALMKAAVDFRALPGTEKLSLLSVPSSKQSHGLLSTHPPIQERLRRMRASVAPSFRLHDCTALGVIVATSTILMLEAIPSSIIYVFALVPYLFPEGQQAAIRISLALSLNANFERTIYATEILVPAIILYFAIPNIKEAMKSRRNAALCGLATCVGLLPIVLYFVLPEQAVTLGGPFPIPKRVWPAPPSTFPSILQAASVYFLALCVLSVLEWVIVPTVKSSLGPLIARYSAKRS